MTAAMNTHRRKNSMKTHCMQKPRLAFFASAWLALALLALVATFAAHAAPPGTAFTYQGFLTENGTPATGLYELRFNLYTTSTSGSPVTPGVTNSSVPVTNGLFTTKLDLGDVFDGTVYWLDIGARPKGSTTAFEILKPRHELTPTPYAIFAETAEVAKSAAPGSVIASSLAANAVTAPSIAANAVGAGKIPNGTVVRSLNGLTEAVTLSAGANVSITPSGNTLQISSSGGGGSVTLPFNGTAASSNPLFKVNNTGTSTAIYGDSTGQIGVVGVGGDKGVYGSTGTAGETHAGVFGENSAPFGTAVIGKALNTDSAGVAGVADTAHSTGVYGRGNSVGVSGNSSSLLGYGVYGSSPLGIGVYGTGLEAGHFEGDVTITGNVSFGKATRQMLDLYATTYGIGVQNFTLYQRTDSGFAWYLGGVHVDDQNSPGSGGKTLMTLDGSGLLTVNGAGGEQAYLGGDGAGADVQIGSRNPAVTAVACWNVANNAYMHLYCSSLTIEGGADLAEPFQISAADNEIPQGAVVVIDEQNPGHLKLSDRPYDTRVAGVVSGANGIHPGIQMQQRGSLEGGKNVSLTGRVYVQADNSGGPIRPGDLLTSSSVPGHAMKVTDHGKAQGAILGKAMSALKDGEGMVLVLVTLQ